MDIQTLPHITPAVPAEHATIDSLDRLVKGAVKFDGDKPRMELVPLDAVKEVAKVLTFGAVKYAPDGWRDVEPHRYTAAMLRHMEAIQQGETEDPESGLPHIAHVACNALFLTHMHLRTEKKHYVNGAVNHES